MLIWLGSALPSGCGTHRGDDLLRGVIEVFRGRDVEIGAGNDLFAEPHIRALEPHHQWNGEPYLPHRGDYTLRDHVAFHDPAEDIDENTFHLRVSGNDLECGCHLLLPAAPADVETVCRCVAVDLHAV